MKADNFHLTEKDELQLAEIFTDKYMDDVKSACRRYLHETGKQKKGVSEDGRTLIEISRKAEELRQLLGDSASAIKRVHLHVASEFNKHDTLLWINDLKKRLETLDDMCFVNPARDRAATPHRGRPAGTVHEAERTLAFHLWEFYRQAHGKPGRRSVDLYKQEVGPLSRAAEILGPILLLPSNLTRYFREIGESFMDNK